MKRTILEEQDGYFKRAVVEEDKIDNNTSVYRFKEGLADNGIAFMNGFVKMLVPAVVIGLIFILLAFYVMCK